MVVLQVLQTTCNQYVILHTAHTLSPCCVWCNSFEERTHIEYYTTLRNPRDCDNSFAMSSDFGSILFNIHILWMFEYNVHSLAVDNLLNVKWLWPTLECFQSIVLMKHSKVSFWVWFWLQLQSKSIRWKQMDNKNEVLWISFGIADVLCSTCNVKENWNWKDRYIQGESHTFR